jgi:polar amino acid transport system substrate-binding protein
MPREVQLLTRSNFMVLCATAISILAMPAAASAADMIGNCELSGQKGSNPIANPFKAGQTTVAVSLPAPIWWNGDTPESITDGME